MNELVEAVERVVQLEATRESTLRSECSCPLDDVVLTETREVIALERGALDDLRTELQRESVEIASLEASASHLETEQAVRNRDEALAGLTSHHGLLEEFETEMRAALEAIDENIDAIGSGEVPEADPEPHLQQAREALEAHNQAVDGLGKNLRILNAYLL